MYPFYLSNKIKTRTEEHKRLLDDDYDRWKSYISDRQGPRKSVTIENSKNLYSTIKKEKENEDTKKKQDKTLFKNYYYCFVVILSIYVDRKWNEIWKRYHLRNGLLSSLYLKLQ